MEGPVMSKMLIFLAVLSGFGIAGCMSEPESLIDAAPETATIDKESFKQRVEARLQEFERRLEELRNKTAQVRAEIRAKLRQDIDELHQKNEAARQRLADMWQHGKDKWEEERLHLEAALEDLHAGFERAFSHAE
jgi:outer membrane murein-binding lipoprotein Lpp